MKQTKRIMSILLCCCLMMSWLFTAFPKVAKAQRIGSKQTSVIADAEVGLIINSLSERITERPVDLKVPYSKFSELGLQVSNDDPGFITPLHVLAQYYIQKKGATVDNIKQYIDINTDGIVNNIEDINGIDKGNNADAQWVCSASFSDNATNNFTTSEVTSQWGKASVYFYGISKAETKFVANGNTMINAAAGVPGDIYLNVSSYNSEDSTLNAMDGATTLVKRINDDGSKVVISPSEGNYTLDEIKDNALNFKFNEIGNYEIYLQKIDGNKRLSNSSYILVNVESKEQYNFKQDWDSVNWPEHNTVMGGNRTNGMITSGITVVGTYGQTKVHWKSSDESIIKITSDYDKDRLLYETTNMGLGDKEVEITANAVDPSGKTYSKTFMLTILGADTTKLSNLEVEGIPNFHFVEGKGTYRFTLDKNMREIKVIATPLATDLGSNLKLKVGSQQYKFGEPITFKIDPNKVLNSFSIVVERYHSKGFSGALAVSKSTYTIEFYKSATTLPAYDAFYGMARVDSSNSSIVNALTPRNINDIDVEATWEKAIRKNGDGMMGWGKWTYPIVVDKHIYIAVDQELRKYDMDGNLVKTGEIGTTVLGGGYTGWLAYGDGMIFVPIGSAVYAFNANDLSPLWRGDTGIHASQSSAPVLYHNGYIYSGITTGGGNPPTGGFYCMDVIDENPDNPTERKDAIWTIEGPSFYWAGACIAGDYLVVPCDTGDVYSIDLKKSITQKKAVIVDILNMSDNDNVGVTSSKDRAQRSRIRSSVLYDDKRNTIYYSSYSGNFHAAKIDNGKFQKGKNNENVKSLSLGVYNNSPVTFNGKVYVCGQKGLNVIDADTFKLLYTAPFEAGEETQLGSLTLSTAYANKENGQQIYLYFNTNTNPNKIYVFADNDKAASGIVKKLYEAKTYPQYSTSNVVVADDGSLLVVNDYCSMLRIKGTATIETLKQEKYVQTMINDLGDKLTDENEEAFLEAEKAYTELTETQKGQIDNAKLIAFRSQYNEKHKEHKENSTSQGKGEENNLHKTINSPDTGDKTSILTILIALIGTIGVIIFSRKNRIHRFTSK